MRSTLRDTLLVLATSACFACTAGAADDVPALDVEPSCRAAASRTLGALTTLDACLEQEASARRDLAARWSSANTGDRERCVNETSLGGIPSYVELLECIAMAGDARTLEASRPQPPTTSGSAGGRWAMSG